MEFQIVDFLCALFVFGGFSLGWFDRVELTAADRA